MTAEDGGEGIRHSPRPTGAAKLAPPRSVGVLIDDIAAELVAGGRFEAADAVREARELIAALYDVPRFWPAMNTQVTVEAEMWRRARAAAPTCRNASPK